MPVHDDSIGLLASPLVHPPGSDEDLAARQAALREGASALLTELYESGIFTDLGPLTVTGSFVSELMCWREVDVMVLVGADFSPHDAMQLMSRIVRFPGLIGFMFRDERAERSPTGEVRDERYHVPLLIDRADGMWCLDLSLWLHDPHQNVTAWHEWLRDCITDEQRAAVLKIKDVWYRRPSYPDQIGGLDVYTAVIEDGIRTPEQFRSWLAERGMPDA
jgi:hypothetical protein